MMRPVALFATGCALAAMTAGARADEMFDTFQTLCMGNRMDESRTIAAADSAGWTLPPQALMDRLLQDKSMQTEARMHALGKATNILILAHGDGVPEDGTTGWSCTLMTIPGETDFEQQARVLAAVPPDPDKDFNKYGSVYIWHEVNGQHIQVLRGGPEAKSLMESGELNYLMTRTEGGMSALSLAVPSK